MNEKHLHIISFNIPYPPNYGGIIDVYYKLKALARNNVKITLHAFEYGREQAAELEQYCEHVYYYKRNTGMRYQFALTPYIVYSRKNKKLLRNLLRDDYPILFEGLHTTYYLDHPKLKKRLKLVRAHNIEHRYYEGLANNTALPKDKLFFLLEAQRLKLYEKILDKADYILSLSTTEKEYFESLYGRNKTIYLPLFADIAVNPYPPHSIKPVVLYQGDLSTPENIRSARFLMRSVAAKDHTIQWVFAGLNPHPSLAELSEHYDNVSLIPNPDSKEMNRLISESAVSVLYTNQVSGVKLKLLNALAKGNHCLATQEMINGSGVESLCRIISHNPKEIVHTIRFYLNSPITKEEQEERHKQLLSVYDNDSNARRIIGLIT